VFPYLQDKVNAVVIITVADYCMPKGTETTLPSANQTRPYCFARFGLHRTTSPVLKEVTP